MPTVEVDNVKTVVRLVVVKFPVAFLYRMVMLKNN